jgi:hypothetical protein
MKIWKLILIINEDLEINPQYILNNFIYLQIDFRIIY